MSTETDKQKEFRRVMTMEVKDGWTLPRTRMTKKDFEHKFLHVAAGRDCHTSRVSEPYVDDDGHCINETLHLYYIENAHAGTWTSGHGWIFSEDRIYKTKTQNAFLEDVYPDLDDVVHS